MKKALFENRMGLGTAGGREGTAWEQRGGQRRGQRGDSEGNSEGDSEGDSEGNSVGTEIVLILQKKMFLMNVKPSLKLVVLQAQR